MTLLVPALGLWPEKHIPIPEEGITQITFQLRLKVKEEFNPSPPVLIYIRQSLNVQSFDPSGSTWFYMQKKEEVDLSHEK